MEDYKVDSKYFIINPNDSLSWEDSTSMYKVVESIGENYIPVSISKEFISPYCFVLSSPIEIYCSYPQYEVLVWLMENIGDISYFDVFGTLSHSLPWHDIDFKLHETYYYHPTILLKNIDDVILFKILFG